MAFANGPINAGRCRVLYFLTSWFGLSLLSKLTGRSASSTIRRITMCDTWLFPAKDGIFLSAMAWLYDESHLLQFCGTVFLPII
jgi:hypothetical protein